MGYPNFKVLIWLLFIVVGRLSGQDFNNYQPLYCEGTLPDAFAKLSSEKAKEDIEAVKSKRINRTDASLEKEYATQSNFLVDDMLTSGNVLFGDPITNYVKKVADVLLASEPELKSKLQFYVLKSSDVNAYTTNNGIVFITVGLISRVKSEAELAFIMAHEIQHYVKKHNITSFKKNAKILSGIGSYGRMDLDQRLKTIYTFSKENEMEADKFGYKLFRKTAYNPYQGLGVFEMLGHVGDPFDSSTLTLDSFQAGLYVFPEELRNKITKRIDRLLRNESTSEDEEEDDEEFSTHPSLDSRIEAIQELLTLEEVKDSGALYLVGEKEFLIARRYARNELLVLGMKMADFGVAYFLAVQEDNIYGPTEFTDKIKAMALYGLAQHRMVESSIKSYGCNYNDYTGSFRPFLVFLSNLNSKEMSVFAARQLYILSKRNKKNAFIAGLRDGLFLKMQVVNKIKVALFLNSGTSSTDTTNKPKKSSKASKQESKYYYLAFTDMQKNDTFRKYIKNIIVESESEDSEDESEEVENYKYSTSKKRRRNFEFDFSSIVFFQPGYNQYNISRGTAKKQFYDEEAMQAQLTSLLVENGKRLGMNVSVLSNLNSNELTTEKLNEYSKMNDWLGERLNNDTITMDLFFGDGAKELMTQYNTKYLAWTGFKYVIKKRPFNLLVMLGSLYLYPTFPLYLIWQLSKDKVFSDIVLIFDVENGKAIYFSQRTESHRPKRDFVNSFTYNLLWRIKYNK